MCKFSKTLNLKQRTKVLKKNMCDPDNADKKQSSNGGTLLQYTAAISGNLFNYQLNLY